MVEGAELQRGSRPRLWAGPEAPVSSPPPLRGASPGRIASLAGPLLLLAMQRLLAKLGGDFAPGLPIKANI